MKFRYQQHIDLLIKDTLLFMIPDLPLYLLHLITLKEIGKDELGQCQRCGLIKPEVQGKRQICYACKRELDSERKLRCFYCGEMFVSVWRRPEFAPRCPACTKENTREKIKQYDVSHKYLHQRNYISKHKDGIKVYYAGWAETEAGKRSIIEAQKRYNITENGLRRAERRQIKRTMIEIFVQDTVDVLCDKILKSSDKRCTHCGRERPEIQNNMRQLCDDCIKERNSKYQHRYQRQYYIKHRGNILHKHVEKQSKRKDR